MNCGASMLQATLRVLKPLMKISNSKVMEVGASPRHSKAHHVVEPARLR